VNSIIYPMQQPISVALESLDQTPAASRSIFTQFGPSQGGAESFGLFVPATLTGRPISAVERDPDVTAPRRPGTGRERILDVAPDFDAPLDDYE